jgi:alpha/beta hydrolase family protein
MAKNHVYVLIHSPLVGPLTWKPVADEMRQRGLDVVVPVLTDSPASKEPFWKQHAQSVSHALSHIPKETFLTLVAHSGTGPSLPSVRQSIANPVNAYVFVDAGIPRNGATRLDLMRSEDPEWGKQFHEELQQGERFPTWSVEDLQEIIPNESLRGQMVAEIRPRGLAFFTEPIPVFAEWPDAPCVYIQFSEPYERSAAQARQAGWPTYKLEAGHFHMLVDPAIVTEKIVQVTNQQF